jgi:hypothetical protein
MSATSGPISPLLQQEHPKRPAHHRHDSSMSSDLSGNFQNIALPPPLNPTSPSSVLSPTSAGAYTNATMHTGTGTGTGSGAGTATSEAKRDEASALEAGSAEPTLVGDALTPMTEKMNPMAAMAASLGEYGMQSSRSATKRKPVGSSGAGGAGEKNAYEENGVSEERGFSR